MHYNRSCRRRMRFIAGERAVGHGCHPTSENAPAVEFGIIAGERAVGYSECAEAVDSPANIATIVEERAVGHHKRSIVGDNPAPVVGDIAVKQALDQVQQPTRCVDDGATSVRTAVIT